MEERNVGTKRKCPKEGIILLLLLLLFKAQSSETRKRHTGPKESTDPCTTGQAEEKGEEEKKSGQP